MAIQSLKELEEAVRKVLDVLGLLSALHYSEVIYCPDLHQEFPFELVGDRQQLCCFVFKQVLLQLKEKALIRAEMSEEEILHLIEERAVARKNKDFARSDQVRSELTSKGISLMDLPTGTAWRRCVPEGSSWILATERCY